MRQDVEFGGLRAAIECFHTDADILGRFLGILDEDVEILIVIENVRIEELEFRTHAAIAVLFDQLAIRELSMRILVEHPHITVSGNVIQMEPVLLCILAMIAFVAGEPEHTLFQNGIAAVPKRQSEHQQLVTVADSRYAVLTPSIRLAARLIVREKVPGISVRTVIFANRSPRAVTDVWPPLAPGRHGAAVGFG